MSELSLQAGRPVVYQDLDDTTDVTVKVTKDGAPVDLSGSTWTDPDGLMTPDDSDAVNGVIGLSCDAQDRGNHDWRLVADGDTTWLKGLLVVGSTRHVGAGDGTIHVAVEDATITVSAVVPTHDHSGAYVSGTTVIKSADETVNNSDTLQDDDELSFPVGADENWTARVALFVDTDSTADIKLAFTVPTGATVIYGVVGQSRGADALMEQLAYATSSGTAISVDMNVDAPVIVEVSVLNGANAGTVQLQWAQSPATASDTTVKAGSSLVASLSS